MLHISLDEVKQYLPERNIYAWHLRYYSELEMYRAVVYMDCEWKGAKKVSYNRFIPAGLAPTAEHLLRLLKASLDEAFYSPDMKALKSV